MEEQGLALVTGGSRGIGRAAVQELAARGYTVVLVGLRDDSVRAATAALVDAGHDVVGEVCDVADADAVQRLHDLLAPMGPMSVLVNSAGVMSERMAKTLRASPDEWNRVIGVNLMGAVNVMRAFVPDMVARRSGRVINVSACMGRSSGPGLGGGLAPYRASKAALNSVTRSLAAETGYGSRGVLVDAMCPAHCRTDMGGPDAPRSASEGADTIVWLATRPDAGVETGRLWEDRSPIPW